MKSTRITREAFCWEERFTEIGGRSMVAYGAIVMAAGMQKHGKKERGLHVWTYCMIPAEDGQADQLLVVFERSTNRYAKFAPRTWTGTLPMIDISPIWMMD